MKRKPIIVICLLSLGLYVLSYFYCTMNGEYVPGGFGAGHVKWYSWAPLGLVDESTNRWRASFSYGYLPLLWLDWKFWHKSEDYDGEWCYEKPEVEMITGEKAGAELQELGITLPIVDESHEGLQSE